MATPHKTQSASVKCWRLARQTMERSREVGSAARADQDSLAFVWNGYDTLLLVSTGGFQAFCHSSTLG